MPVLGSLSAIYGYGRAEKSTSVVEFDYPNFSSTDGLTQVFTAGVIDNLLYLTETANNDVGNVYRSTAIRYNRSFSFEWNFECSGGSSPPADGFCLQWTTTNNTNGSIGGGVGYINVATTINAFTFLTFSNNNFTWYEKNVGRTPVGSQNFYRNLYFWADYNHAASTMNIYFSTTITKPANPNFSLTSFSFDSANYYIGFGAATGGATENHILRSMKLTFT